MWPQFRKCRWVLVASLVAALAACAQRTSAARPTPASSPGAVAIGQSPHLRAIEGALDLDKNLVGALEPNQSATLAMVFTSWCGHCRDEMPIIAQLQAKHRDLRVLGVNYLGHEEYGGRGNADAVRAFVAEFVHDGAPWLRVVPADEEVWSSLGSPARVPTLYVFDRNGTLVRAFDRRTDRMPSLAEIEAVLPH